MVAIINNAIKAELNTARVKKTNKNNKVLKILYKEGYITGFYKTSNEKPKNKSENPTTKENKKKSIGGQRRSGQPGCEAREYIDVKFGGNNTTGGQRPRGSQRSVFPIKKINIISKGGLRIYKGIREIKEYKNGIGITLISTPKGIMTLESAKKMKLGGEVLLNCY